ncbi:MAG: sensor histidine kinase [Spirochaetales bacterium]
MLRLGPWLVPLAALTLVQAANLLLAALVLPGVATHPLGYIPWVLLAGWGLGTVLLAFRPDPVISFLLLACWAMSVQLLLLPPGLPPTFGTLAVAPVLAVGVLALPRWWGPTFSLGVLLVSLLTQGPRLAWGLEVPGADAPSQWSLAVLGVTLVLGAWSVRAAFARAERAQTELAHLKEGLGQIIQANVGFQDHAASMEAASSRRERLHITREIHDIVGYTLTNQTMVLQAAKVLIDRDHERLRELLESAEEAARSGLQEVRQALRQLRAEAERPPGLLNRLHHLCRTFEQATSVQVRLSGDQLPEELPDGLEPVLYRIVQEGLTNAFLHGKATKVTARLALERRPGTDSSLSVAISDNGQGADSVVEGIGLTGMRERLSGFGATLVYRAEAHGFTVSVQIPLPALPTPEVP